MKILWFPRLQFDIDALHITTWREMSRELEQSYNCEVKIAIAGKPINNSQFHQNYIRIFIVKRKFLRIITFLIFGYFKFLYNYFFFKPNATILDIYSIWFSIPLAFLPKKSLFIIDNRTPFYDLISQESKLQDKMMKFYIKICYWYCKHFLDGMTVITDYYKNYVHKDFKFDNNLIGIWESGVSVDKFLPQKYIGKNRPPFLTDKFVLMQHGQLSYNRGLFETVKALKILNKEDICLLLLGSAIPGSNAGEDVRFLVKKLNLEQNVYILPPVPHSEIPKYISFCDCAIMAYPNIEFWNNNNPIKLLEYLAMGKVVICTDMWTFRNVVESKKCAYYIKDNRPESIAKAINYCYENKKLLYEWGKEGIDIVKEKYTWGRQAKRLLDFIENLKKK